MNIKVFLVIILLVSFGSTQRRGQRRRHTKNDEPQKPSHWKSDDDIYKMLTPKDKMTCASVCPDLGDISSILVCAIHIFDANKDFIIENEEMSEAKSKYLSFFEKPFAPVGKWMSLLDDNQDGVVSVDEIRTYGPDRMTCTDFYRIDKYFCGRMQK